MARFQVCFLLFLSLVLPGCGGSSSSSSGAAANNPPPPPPPAPGPVDFSVQQVFANLSFSRPVAMLQAPADSSRWFVVEQRGEVHVFDNDAGVSATSIFVDISAQVDCCGEKGLLGMAIHPNFANNNQVFLSYTRSGPVSYISRFTSSDGGLTLDPATEAPLLIVPQDFSNHNGGHITFGPDGFLYIGFGDGGSGNDPNNRAQDTSNLLGAMLRIDVDSAVPYGIPQGNPFAGNALCSQGFGGASCPEIFAYGLRNPWRWNFDSQNGDLWVADVGQNDWEEVDIVSVGGNYGWRTREGAHCNPNLNNPSCSSAGLIDPVAEYDHSVGNSITGGYVYRGTAVPELVGSYVYGDFGSGRVFRAFDNGSGSYDFEEVINTTFSISAFAQANDGELFIVNLVGGELYQIVPSN